VLVIANQLRRERDGFSRSRGKALLHASPVAAYLVGSPQQKRSRNCVAQRNPYAGLAVAAKRQRCGRCRTSGKSWTPDPDICEPTKTGTVSKRARRWPQHWNAQPSMMATYWMESRIPSSSRA